MWRYRFRNRLEISVRNAALALIGFAGCGGADAPAQEPRAAAVEASAPEEPTDVGEPAAPGEPCRDGQCFRCGDALCLPGFYCDEARAACGWLPQCRGALSCECVEQTLSGCQCEERHDGVYVHCQ